MFLDFLLSQNMIDELQYNRVLAELDHEYNGDMTAALVAVGLKEDAITQSKASFYHLPYVKVGEHDVTPESLHYIPEEAAQQYKFVPLSFSDGVLSIGVTEPENIEGMNALQFMSVKLGVPFKMFLISPSDRERIMQSYKSLSAVATQDVNELDKELQGDLELSTKSDQPLGTTAIKKSTIDDAKQNGKIVEDAPIIKIVAVIIEHAVEGLASDIHIENTGSAVNVRYRVDGTLHTTLVLPLGSFDAIIARIKILSKLRLDEKRKPQDGSFATVIDGRKIEFRVSTFPAYYGEKVVLRILDSEHGVKNLDDLDMTPEDLQMVKEGLARPYGLILISGPTGSGKSTTLYSMLSAVDKEGSNVVSLEDPVEYQIPGVTQSQVMPEIGYTFASGLRSILRQDPNIIMVGEIRDKETAELAIQAALTGHLVLSTIHTNSAIGIIPRLVDMGIDPYLIAPTLIMAMAQRLVRKVHPSSRHEVPMDEATKEFIDKQFTDLDPKYKEKLGIGDKMFEIRPSSEAPSGTRGRIAVFEMFNIDREMQQVILKNPTEPEIYKLARSKGMISLKEDGILKALKGEVDMKEVYGL
ncbi:MAG TPA: GspE/PulE family protein [Candidatus Paceibacterota bacterium]|jgi:type IV pilus assembly protein PilB|nr:GspE/PulE family protein [Candidatus Paceibacterota bacterium]